MFSSRDVLTVLTQLREGIKGLGSAADLVHDPQAREKIAALREQLDAVITRVEQHARDIGVIPARTILPRPGVHRPSDAHVPG